MKSEIKFIKFIDTITKPKKEIDLSGREEELALQEAENQREEDQREEIQDYQDANQDATNTPY